MGQKWGTKQSTKKVANPFWGGMLFDPYLIGTTECISCNADPIYHKQISES